MAIGYEQAILEGLDRFVVGNSQNMLFSHGGIPIYDKPLVGFASAQDPLFMEFKKPEIIGEKHLLPTEWMSDAKTVIAFFLPLSKEIRKSNYSLGMPSKEITSKQVAIFCAAVQQHLVEIVEELGGHGMAPSHEKLWNWRDLVSNWSERHAAYVAGLGTFGLNKTLITSKGGAGRFGAVITSLEITPTPRLYEHKNQYCPFIMNGSCGHCIKRCPVGAITYRGKNNWICKGYLDLTNHSFAPWYGCAKCQMAVPCEASIPYLKAKTTE